MTAIGDCRKTIETAEGKITYYSLKELERQGIIKDLKKMPCFRKARHNDRRPSGKFQGCS